MKKIIQLLLLSFLPAFLQAQTPSVIWQKYYGGSFNDDGRSICKTRDNNYAVAGSTYSYDGDIAGMWQGAADVWVTKIHPSGALIWERTIGGPYLDQAYSISSTTDSGYIICGSTNSNSGDVSGNHGNGDALVVKLNASGGIVWAKCYGGSNSEEFLAMQPCIEGGFIAVGTTASNDGDVSGFHGGVPTDVWVVRLDDTGHILWQKALGGTGEDVGRSLIQTNDSGFIIAGYSSSANGDVTFNHGGTDCWLIKLSKTGVVEWQKCLGGTGKDAALSITAAIGGGFIFAGQTSSTDGDVSHFKGGTATGGDVWVVHVSDVGDVIWERTFGGSSNEVGNSILRTANGKYIVSGWTNSNDGQVSGKKDTTDIWTFQTNDAGILEWQHCMGDDYWEMAHDIIETQDGNVLITGVGYSFGSGSAGSHGMNDRLVFELGIPPANASTLVKSEISLQPNPSNGTFWVNGLPDEPYEFVVTDLRGRLVYSQPTPKAYITTPPVIQLNVSPGIYFIRIVSNTSVSMIPIQIQ